MCIYKGGYDKAYGNQTLIYMGKVDGINAFHSSYSKTYLNLKMPIIEENCIKIKSSEFKSLFHMMLFLKQTNHIHKEFA